MLTTLHNWALISTMLVVLVSCEYNDVDWPLNTLYSIKDETLVFSYLALTSRDFDDMLWLANMLCMLLSICVCFSSINAHLGCAFLSSQCGVLSPGERQTQ